MPAMPNGSVEGVGSTPTASEHDAVGELSDSFKLHAFLGSGEQSDFQVKEDAKVLFEPLQLGALQLQHKIIMAPLTRCRSPNNVPISEVAAKYYSQRASPGGLIISEGTTIEPRGHGTDMVPGIYRQEQIEAWKPVVKAVKDKGGFFFMQLWHEGRASHPDFQPNGDLPIAPSAIPVGDKFNVNTPKGGPFPYPVPRPLEESEIPGVIQLYAQAAKNAIAAGFDGVEIHGANGYLLDQFWKDFSNNRTDGYGGSIEKQGRLMLEVTEAVAAAVGAECTGLRLSPFNTFLSAQDEVPRAIEKNVWLMKELGKRVPDLAYIHMVEPRLASGNVERECTQQESLEPFKAATSHKFIAAGGFKRDSAIEAVRDGKIDAVVFGRYFISNPDLPKRIAIDAPWTHYDRNTFYTHDPVEGYTDYKFLEEEEEQQQEGKQGGKGEQGAK